MAFLVLFSTLSFTVEKHYCGDHLVDTAVFTKVKKCTDASTMPKPCCKDDVEVVKGQDQLKINGLDDLDFNTQIVFTAFVYSFFQFQESLPKQTIPHKYYSPPKLVADLQVLHDVYII
ncbi:MAG TPA: hypothetical protein EYO76_09370 [Flavobacteriaceae bacterium]|nr:hypothetical protein [Flavobacteriaceae bacterium]